MGSFALQRHRRFSVTFLRAIYLGNCDQVAERHFFSVFHFVWGAPTKPNGARGRPHKSH